VGVSSVPCRHGKFGSGSSVPWRRCVVWRVLGRVIKPLEAWRIRVACPRLPRGVAGSGSVSSDLWRRTGFWGASPRSPGGVAASGGVCRSHVSVASLAGVSSVSWRRGRFGGRFLVPLEAWRVRGCVLKPLEAWRVWGACPRAPGGVLGSGGVFSVPWRLGGFGGVFGSLEAWRVRGGSAVPWRRGGFGGRVLDPLSAWRICFAVFCPVEAWRVRGRVLGPLKALQVRGTCLQSPGIVAVLGA